MRIFNSLTRQIEEVRPLDPPFVTMYTCGPTVYSFAHIGNFRTYTMADVLLRVLKVNSFKPTYIMNLTDVGHLTGDNLGDADIGEDRMEKSARKEGKTAWEVADFYAEAFLHDFEKLNLLKPEHFVKATEHIKEQIELIEKLAARGFTYQTTDGIYFDTSKFANYGLLSNLTDVKEGARVRVNPEKKNPRDFALWKFSPNPKSGGQKRQMEWQSPFGTGFPGWHIECSAMSMKYLGESLDIHAGGIDLRETHHPNEIAQSEAATGKQFVKYWFHVAFMLVGGERMSKSLGNNYKLYDLEKEGFDPLSLRYLYLQTHYRQEMNFSFQALEGAKNALEKIKRELETWDKPGNEDSPYTREFLTAVNDDLNLPEALAVMWKLFKSPEPSSVKAHSLFKMDQVLGLGFEEFYYQAKKDISVVPMEVRDLVAQRERLRRDKHFQQSDTLRRKIRKLGYDVEDTKNGTKIHKITPA